ncbi:MAG: fibronectin type III domain-containing protein [Candidatus Hydrogenedentes bacterium]|nr:fibronectin type III domain-containing protein [Candidatus Hydrogenedentota bacterium]
MARFPLREADGRTLAQNIISGLTSQAALFPAPPVAPATLQAALDAFSALSEEAVAARAHAEQVTARKVESFEELKTLLKSDIRYAEDAVKYDDAKLGFIGWGARAAPSPLQPPGQPLGLETGKQGEGWLTLHWKAPVDGGPWVFLEVAMKTEITLNNQERGKDWEYRVIAVNKANASEPSNTVAAML